MNRYTFIIPLILYSLQTSGQACFPDSNAIWNINTFDIDRNPTSGLIYGLKGDTLINDTLFNKLYLLSDTSLESKNLKEYIGCFRQDTQRVWFRPGNGNATECLLYDFSKQPGDTIWHNVYLHHLFDKVLIFDSCPYCISIILDKYDDDGLIILDVETGIYSKEYGYFLWSIRHDCLFGIGSTIGLFWQHYEPPIGYANTIKNLACFKQNDTVKYESNEKCDKCFCGGFGSIEEKKDFSDGILVFPNPAENFILIKIDKPYNNIRAELLDEKGSIVYSEESIKNTINVNNILKGIYFLNLTIDNEKITKKVIIE